MLCAPVVACEISDPPTTPRGTSWSAPGLTTFIEPRLSNESTSAPSLPPLTHRTRPRRHLDLERPGLMVDLERRVVDAELLLEQLMQIATKLVAVVAGADDDVRRQ